MYQSVSVNRVRCLTGTFGLAAKQMAKFAQTFPMATSGAVCQMWRGLGQSRSTDVFPSYTLLLGTAAKSTTTLPEDLLESAVAVQNNWASTLYPHQLIMPHWSKMDPDEAFRSVAHDTDWGHVKMKKVDVARWIPHVHQVLFLVRHSRARPRSSCQKAKTQFKGLTASPKSRRDATSVQAEQM